MIKIKKKYEQYDKQHVVVAPAQDKKVVSKLTLCASHYQRKRYT